MKEWSGPGHGPEIGKSKNAGTFSNYGLGWQHVDNAIESLVCFLVSRNSILYIIEEKVHRHEARKQ